MPVKPIGITVGALDKTSCNIVVWSLTGTDTILTVNGVDYTVAMQKLGNDRPTPDNAGETWACYYGVQPVTGLNPFTQYNATAVQETKIYSVNFRTLPANNSSKFSLSFTTCFAPNNGGSTGTTAYSFLSWYRKNTDYPMLAMIHTDDVYYADGWFGAKAGDNNTQGKVKYANRSASNTPQPQYDYGLCYAMWAGILEPFTSVNFPVGAEVMSTALTPAFQDCVDNMAFMPAWGDHEFQNNLGWTGGPALTTVPNGYHQTLNGFDGNGLLVWKAIMTPLQGKPINAEPYALDIVSNHWYQDFGCLRVVVADSVTNAIATTQLYGANQIKDILETVNRGSQWFTNFARPAGAGRGGTPGYKDENYIASEYDRLYLSTGLMPPSFMDNPKTNGLIGGFWTTRGDWHGAYWSYWDQPATTGKAAESVHEIGLSTVNNSSGEPPDLHNSDAIFAAANAVLIGGTTAIDATTFKPNEIIMTIVEVDGTLQTPQCVVKQWGIEVLASDGIDQSGFFMPIPEGIERVTDDYGNIWRKCGERKFVLNSGSNKGYNKLDTPFELSGFSSTERLI